MPKRQISMWLDADLLDHIAAQAARTGQTRNQWITDALRYGLAANGIALTHTITHTWTPGKAVQKAPAAVHPLPDTTNATHAKLTPRVAQTLVDPTPVTPHTDKPPPTIEKKPEPVRPHVWRNGKDWRICERCHWPENRAPESCPGGD
jgi:hypothetical protein